LCLAKNNFLSLFFLSQELPPSLLRSSSSKSSSQQEREKEERRHYRICHRNLDRVVIRARLHYRRSPFFLKGIKLRNSLCLREGEPYLPAAFTSAPVVIIARMTGTLKIAGAWEERKNVACGRDST
jgi:hypothetical protein